MKITWVGHSCFTLESGGYKAVVDPYADGSVPGYAPVRETANEVLCSHGHGDHNGRECVKLEASEAPGFQVDRIETWHDDVKGAKRGPNTIHLISDGKCRVAHLGDLGCELEPDQKERLKGLDVLLIPVGGFFTIDAAQAAELVSELQPRYVIPMHFRNAAVGYDVIGTVDDFIQRMDHAVVLDASEFDTESAPSAWVIVLRPKNSSEASAC